MHYPNGAEYYTTVFGYSVVLLICLLFFIHYLRVGLHSHESVQIDSKSDAVK